MVLILPSASAPPSACTARSTWLLLCCCVVAHDTAVSRNAMTKAARFTGSLRDQVRTPGGRYHGLRRLAARAESARHGAARRRSVSAGHVSPKRARYFRRRSASLAVVRRCRDAENSIRPASDRLAADAQTLSTSASW